MNFDAAFDIVLRHEGGYVWNEADPGGETKYGISKRAYPAEDIAGLTIARAREIYRLDYWDKIQGDQLPGAVAVHVFDAAVNSGVRQATKWLQYAVGTTADGIIGAKTIAATRSIDPNIVVLKFVAQRLRFLTALPTWPQFGRGWARRVASNILEIHNV